MALDDVDAGREDGVTLDEYRDLVSLRRRDRVLTEMICGIHRDSQGTYGAGRTHLRPRHGRPGNGPLDAPTATGHDCPRRRGAQYTNWIFGHRLGQAGLFGSVGRVTSSVDNALIESFWSTTQRELLDRQSWDSRDELSRAIFEWIEGFYNPYSRHTGLTDGHGRSLSAVNFEALHTRAEIAA